MEWSYIFWFCVAYWIFNRIEKSFIDQHVRISRLEQKLGVSEDNEREC